MPMARRASISASPRVDDEHVVPEIAEQHVDPQGLRPCLDHDPGTRLAGEGTDERLVGGRAAVQ